MTSSLSAAPASNSSLHSPSWKLTLTCVFLGSPQDPEYIEVIQSLRLSLSSTSAIFNVTSLQTYSSWWQYLSGFLDHIDPLPRYFRGTDPPIGLYDYFASVFVGRKELIPIQPVAPSTPAASNTSSSSAMSAFLTGRLKGCLAGLWPCLSQQMYQIKGASGSIGRKRDVSLSEGFISATTMLVSSTNSKASMVQYDVLGPNSYFSQSAYLLDNWKQRYWGQQLYARLAATKMKWDPMGRFSCHHCVGDGSSNTTA